VFNFTKRMKRLLKEQEARRDALRKQGFNVPWVFFRIVAKGRGREKQPTQILSMGKRSRPRLAPPGFPVSSRTICADPQSAT
jgi:hypothetical protein